MSVYETVHSSKLQQVPSAYENHNENQQQQHIPSPPPPMRISNEKSNNNYNINNSNTISPFVRNQQQHNKNKKRGSDAMHAIMQGTIPAYQIVEEAWERTNQQESALRARKGGYDSIFTGTSSSSATSSPSSKTNINNEKIFDGSGGPQTVTTSDKKSPSTSASAVVRVPVTIGGVAATVTTVKTTTELEDIESLTRSQYEVALVQHLEQKHELVRDFLRKNLNWGSASASIQRTESMLREKIISFQETMRRKLILCSRPVIIWTSSASSTKHFQQEQVVVLIRQDQQQQQEDQQQQQQKQTKQHQIYVKEQLFQLEQQCRSTIFQSQELFWPRFSISVSELYQRAEIDRISYILLFRRAELEFTALFRHDLSAAKAWSSTAYDVIRNDATDFIQRRIRKFYFPSQCLHFEARESIARERLIHEEQTNMKQEILSRVDVVTNAIAEKRKIYRAVQSKMPMPWSVFEQRWEVTHLSEAPRRIEIEIEAKLTMREMIETIEEQKRNFMILLEQHVLVESIGTFLIEKKIDQQNKDYYHRFGENLDLSSLQQQSGNNNTTSSPSGNNNNTSSAATSSTNRMNRRQSQISLLSSSSYNNAKDRRRRSFGVVSSTTAATGTTSTNNKNINSPSYNSPRFLEKKSRNNENDDRSSFLREENNDFNNNKNNENNEKFDEKQQQLLSLEEEEADIITNNPYEQFLQLRLHGSGQVPFDFVQKVFDFVARYREKEELTQHQQSKPFQLLFDFERERRDTIELFRAMVINQFLWLHTEVKDHERRGFFTAKVLNTTRHEEKRMNKEQSMLDYKPSTYTGPRRSEMNFREQNDSNILAVWTQVDFQQKAISYFQELEFSKILSWSNYIDKKIHWIVEHDFYRQKQFERWNLQLAMIKETDLILREEEWKRQAMLGWTSRVDYHGPFVAPGSLEHRLSLVVTKHNKNHHHNHDNNNNNNNDNNSISSSQPLSSPPLSPFTKLVPRSPFSSSTHHSNDDRRSRIRSQDSTTSTNRRDSGGLNVSFNSEHDEDHLTNHHPHRTTLSPQELSVPRIHRKQQQNLASTPQHCSTPPNNNNNMLLTSSTSTPSPTTSRRATTTTFLVDEQQHETNFSSERERQPIFDGDVSVSPTFSEAIANASASFVAQVAANKNQNNNTDSAISPASVRLFSGTSISSNRSSRRKSSASLVVNQTGDVFTEEVVVNVMEAIDNEDVSAAWTSMMMSFA